MTLDNNNFNDIIGIALWVISLIWVAFAVYKSYRKPQEDVEKKEWLLSQKVEFERCATEKKFEEFWKRLDQAFALAQNHVHTVDVKCDKLIESSNQMAIEIWKLSTIIDERMPKK